MHGWLVNMLAALSNGPGVDVGGETASSAPYQVYPSEYVMAVFIGGMLGLFVGFALGTIVQWVTSFASRAQARGGPHWAGYGAFVGALVLVLWRMLR